MLHTRTHADTSYDAMRDPQYQLVAGRVAKGKLYVLILASIRIMISNI